MELHSKILGEGNPFVILHGFLGMGDNWKSMARRIAELGYEVHLIDQRNHGRSPHDAIFNYDLLSEDLNAYCVKQKLASITLLGHSMGGKTAMKFAVQNPEQVKRLIIADIGPKFYAPHHQTILDGLRAIDFSEIASRNDADVVLSKYVVEKGIRQFLLKNLYWKEKGVLDFRMNLEVLSENVNEIGKALLHEERFRGATLFLKGENSEYIQEEDVPVIQSHFPSAIVNTISNASHWLHAEQPTLFFEEVKRFVL